MVSNTLDSPCASSFDLQRPSGAQMPSYQIQAPLDMLPSHFLADLDAPSMVTHILHS